MKWLLPLAACSLAALALSSAPASAGLTVSVLDDGVAVPLVTTIGSGKLTANGTDANFTDINVVATGAPAIPSPDLGVVTLDVTGHAGTHVLDVLVTQTGLSVPAGFASQTTNTFNGLIGAPGPITQTMFVNGGLLNTVTFPASSSTATKDFTNLIGAPISSDAAEFKMTFTGAQAAEETIAFEAVAVREPAAFALVGTMLIGLSAVFGRPRRRALA